MTLRAFSSHKTAHWHQFALLQGSSNPRGGSRGDADGGFASTPTNYTETD
ncbi:hypothetical protein MTsPCn3_17040 [Erythrobacter sp. MTPC3]